MLLRLATELATRNFEIHVAVLDDPPHEQIPADGSVPVHFLSAIHGCPAATPFARDRPRSVYQSNAAAEALNRLIRKLEPDFVHYWDVVDRPFSAKPALRRCDYRELETVLGNRQRETTVRNFVLRRLRKRTDVFIVPGDSTRQNLIDQDVDEHRIAIIPNGVCKMPVTANRAAAKAALVKLLHLPGETTMPPESLFIAGTVAPLRHRSRLKDLVWATDLLTCIRDDFHLIIAGVGPQRSQLRHFASLTEASDHVHFLPLSDRSAIIQNFSAGLDVFWNANLNSPLPAAMMECMAHGIPTISTLGDGTREVIRHQETGLAVNFGARDEFARWTKYLIERPEAAAQLGQQGRTAVLRDFPLDAMVERYANVYSQAL